MSLNSSVDDSFEDSSDGSFEDSPLPVLTNMVISEPAETTEPSDGFVLPARGDIAQRIAHASFGSSDHRPASRRG